MTLQEAEGSLQILNDKIGKLLKEREKVLKEWNVAFNSENPQNIVCVDEGEGQSHDLYLVNSESKMLVCRFNDLDIRGSINDFYKFIDKSMRILNIANGRDYEPLDYQKNLVYAKASEIREQMGEKEGGL